MARIPTFPFSYYAIVGVGGLYIRETYPPQQRAPRQKAINIFFWALTWRSRCKKRKKKTTGRTGGTARDARAMRLSSLSKCFIKNRSSLLILILLLLLHLLIPFFVFNFTRKTIHKWCPRLNLPILFEWKIKRWRNIMECRGGTHEKSSLLLGLGVLCRGLRDLPIIVAQTERGEERNVYRTHTAAAHTSHVVKCIVRHHAVAVVRTWILASLLHHHLMRPLLRSLLTGACLVYWGFTFSRQTFFFIFSRGWGSQGSIGSVSLLVSAKGKRETWKHGHWRIVAFRRGWKQRRKRKENREAPVKIKSRLLTDAWCLCVSTQMP